MDGYLQLLLFKHCKPKTFPEEAFKSLLPLRYGQ